MTFSMRDFAAGDTAAILALNMHAQNPEADIASSLRHYPELLDIPANFQRDGAFIVGLVDGVIIAMGSITPADESVFEIDYIRVAISHQRRGYARAVMKGLEARVFELGGTAAILRVSADNTAARNLYESMGYVVDMAADTVYDVDGNAFHPVKYRKDLFSLSTLAKMRDDLLTR